MNGSTPLHCEKCNHDWNYGGKALLDPSMRVQCPRCNSMRIIDTLGNKVNKGFRRAKQASAQAPPANACASQTSINAGQAQIPTPQHTPQHTPTLELSEAHKMLGQPIPTLQQIKKGIPTPTPTTPTTVPVSGIKPIPAVIFTGDDFKIVYALGDDFMAWMTKNKGLAHTVQRRKEMGDLLAKMLNKYGINAALEIIFVVAHLAYFSPVVYHYYQKRDKSKKEKKEDDLKKSPETTVETVETPEVIEEVKAEPTKTKETLKDKLFSKGHTMTVGEYVK